MTHATSPSSRRVLVLNGPNLGRLGTREPEIYGDTSYAELEALCVGGGRELGLDVTVRQTESEAELLGWLHEAADERLPVVLNAGARANTIDVASKKKTQLTTTPALDDGAE